jgi:hypothetical protein
MLGGDGRALDQGQQVALDTFPGDVRPGADFAADLVDFVQEDDAPFSTSEIASSTTLSSSSSLSDSSLIRRS